MALFVLAALAMVVAIGVYVAGRLRTGEPLTVSPRVVLLGYLYLMSLAGLLTCTLGLTTSLKVGLGTALGSDFSYYRPMRLAMPLPVIGAPKDEAITVGEAARFEAELERQRRQDIIQSATAVVVGLVVFAAHTLGRRRVGLLLPTVDSLLRRGYTAFLLAVFGIGGLIGLIMGLQALLQFWLLPTPDEFNYRNPPGQSVATAIVFVPLWLFYLLALVRQSRDQEA
ncbi:MAG: hypothetical protein EXR52_08545 [Dehalococcoidia bacterium]|nr:hypothetical protein [Dehalococcoidia bacterium]